MQCGGTEENFSDPHGSGSTVPVVSAASPGTSVSEILFCFKEISLIKILSFH